MKNLIYLPIALGIISCNGGEKHEEITKTDYVSLSGKITNLKEGGIVIKDQSEAYSKTIAVKEDGSFSDTLKVPDSINSYYFTYGEEYGRLFLANNNDLSFTLNTEEFDESLMFKGSLAPKNNYLAAATLSEEDFNLMELVAASNENFEEDLKTALDSKKALLKQYSEKLDSSFIANQEQSIEMFATQVKRFHTQEVEKATTLASLVGNPSPIFENYTTPEGKTMSLNEFQGKYTYIDVWATWCNPCKAEIPFLKEFVASELGEKMNVLSVSVDEEKDLEKWQAMAKEETAKNWTQLRADSAWKSSFVKKYAINSIPRFILLDPQGNVVDADAPRPSSEEFKTMIGGLSL